MDLKKDVIFAAESYARTEIAKLDLKGRERMLAAGCMRAGAITGIMLAARLLAAEEGSEEVTPQLLEKAAIQAAQELGLMVNAVEDPNAS